LLKNYLAEKSYTPTQINKAIDKLTTTAKNYNDNLYTTNKNVYHLLRYGVKVKAAAGENFETVHLINWNNFTANDFALAEEVTINGEHTKRPDIVLYVNGIALGILELKRSTVSIGEGIRQSLTNQQDTFIQAFFLQPFNLFLPATTPKACVMEPSAPPKNIFYNGKKMLKIIVD
jgi:type I restriction enzyme R subunit